LFLLTSSVSADRVFIFVRLLFTQQPGNTHGIYHHALSALHHRQFHEAVARVEDLDGGLLVIIRFGQ